MRDLMNEVKVRLITSEKNILYMCLLQKKKNNKKHSSNNKTI